MFTKKALLITVNADDVDKNADIDLLFATHWSETILTRSGG